jgi:hypothetical protein
MRETEARVNFGTRWVKVRHRDLQAKTSRASARSSAPSSTKIPWRSSTAGGIPSSRRCGCTTAPSTAGTAPASASPTASRTCASRTASCPRAQRGRRDRQRRVLVRSDGPRWAHARKTSPSASTSIRRRQLLRRRARGPRRPLHLARRRRGRRASAGCSTGCSPWPRRACRRQGIEATTSKALPGRRGQRVRNGRTGAAGSSLAGTPCATEAPPASAPTPSSPPPSPSARGDPSPSGSARASTRPSPAEPAHLRGRAIHDDRPVHRARRRPRRDRRQPDGSGSAFAMCRSRTRTTACWAW